jgi:hypothetical protein
MSCFVSGCSATLEGCYFKLVKPEPQTVSIDSIRALHSNTAKFSYSGLSSGVIEKALLDSLTAYGIHDVIKSEKLEQDRVNIIAYVFDVKPSKISRYIGLPWALISLGTLFVVPNYEEQVYPVEIHVINPSSEYDKQLKIIRSEYDIGGGCGFRFSSCPTMKNERMFNMVRGMPQNLLT